MALVAPIVDGKIQETSASAQSLSNSQKTQNGSTLDKDSFLQLLVAQMKYQDPLEPTSNTEYISQFATFSELEQMQNMNATVNLQRASSLVGKNVIMTVTAKNGSVNHVVGKVDYVEFENNKAYLSIGGNLYSMDDLSTVVEDGYQEAFDKANDLLTQLYKLPSSTKALTISDMDAVLAIKKTFNEMTDYEKGFFTKEEVALFNSYFDKMKELMKAAGIAEPVEEKQLTVEEMLEALLGKMDSLVEGVGGIAASSGSGGGTKVVVVEKDGATDSTTKTEGVGSTDQTEEDKTEGTDKTEEGSKSEDSSESEKTEESSKSDEDSSSDDSSSGDDSADGE